jgi:ketosteroid isomerase-like protein
MASANLDLARSIYSNWERGDFSSTAWADPEIEYVIVDGPAPGSWKGLTALEEAGLGVLRAWKDLRVEAEACRELDNERVFVLTRLSGRGKTSDLELGQMRAKGLDLLHIRDGKVIRFVLYWDRARAFTDIGIAPETDA